MRAAHCTTAERIVDAVLSGSLKARCVPLAFAPCCFPCGCPEPRLLRLCARCKRRDAEESCDGDEVAALVELQRRTWPSRRRTRRLLPQLLLPPPPLRRAARLLAAGRSGLTAGTALGSLGATRSPKMTVRTLPSQQLS